MIGGSCKMQTYGNEDLAFYPVVQGSDTYTKVSYPIRYGRYSEIRTASHRFQFNLNGEIRFIQGTGSDWPHPQEWLKRTAANDWVYYATGGYTGVFDTLGEYYLPLFPYPSNTISSRRPFSEPAIRHALAEWEKLADSLGSISVNTLGEGAGNMVSAIRSQGPPQLERRAARLQRILGQRTTVLPPDARHTDYDVIPINIADGCLYRCDFCSIKSNRTFRTRSRSDIIQQIRLLRDLYGRDLPNCNSVFLGQHDALMAGADAVISSAMSAYEILGLGDSGMTGSSLFLFSSVDALLRLRPSELDLLNGMPYRTYVNVGLESVDSDTLEMIGKGTDARTVAGAFHRMLDINREYDNLEVTANFLFDDSLPDSHTDAFCELMESLADHAIGKGTLYFSPLCEGRTLTTGIGGQRQMMNEFFKIKNRSRLPAYIYLIQRL